MKAGRITLGTESAEFSFSRGWDRGNYGNAYESNDWESWFEDACGAIPSEMEVGAYQEGMLLGFFSSYEVHEIPEDLMDEVIALRAKHGEEQ